MTHQEKIHAITHLRPYAEWTMNNGVLTWLDQAQTEPTEQEIEAACHACKFPDAV